MSSLQSPKRCRPFSKHYQPTEEALTTTTTTTSTTKQETTMLPSLQWTTNKNRQDSLWTYHTETTHLTSTSTTSTSTPVPTHSCKHRHTPRQRQTGRQRQTTKLATQHTTHIQAHFISLSGPIGGTFHLSEPNLLKFFSNEFRLEHPHPYSVKLAFKSSIFSFLTLLHSYYLLYYLFAPSTHRQTPTQWSRQVQNT